LIEHIQPIDKWGTNYHVTPIAGRQLSSFIRIFASEPNTTVYRNGIEWFHLSQVGGVEPKGWTTRRAVEEKYENHIDPVIISADKPIQVVQFNHSSTSGDNGSDPFMMVLTPIENYYTETLFCTPGDPDDTYWCFEKNYVNVIYKANADGTIPDSLEYGIPSDNGEIVWNSFNKVIDKSMVQNFINPDTTDGRYWYNAQLLLPNPSGVYAMRSAEPFMLYGYGSQSAESYGYPIGGIEFYTKGDDNEQNKDNVAPIVEYTQGCYGNITATGIELPDDDDIRSNFESIALIQEQSNNYMLIWKPSKLEKGITRELPFELKVIDESVDGKAVVKLVDVDGNETLVEFDYFAVKLEFDSTSANFGDIFADDTVITKTMKLYNRSSKTVIIDSLYLISENNQMGYSYNGFKVSNNLYSNNNGKLPNYEFIQGDSLEFEVTFDPNTIKNLIDQGQMTFIDSIYVKAEYNEEVAEYCFSKSVGVVSASFSKLESPVIKVSDLDFGTIEVAIPKEKAPVLKATIENVGGSDLIITDITVVDTVFTHNWFNKSFPITIEPRQAEEISVSFIPSRKGEITGKIEFVSNSDFNDFNHDAVLELNGLGIILEKPKQLSPENKSTEVPLTPTFIWSKVNDIDKYRIYVDETDTFANPIIEKEVTGTEYTVTTPLDYSTKYYWYLVARDNGNMIVSEDVWSFTTVADVGISDELKSTLRIQPNPADEFITVVSDYFIQNIKIYNQSGQLMLETEKSKIDISELATGVYFLIVESENGIEKGVFIKE
jgi:hypothetical protein